MATVYKDNVTVADQLTVGKDATVTGTFSAASIQTSGSITNTAGAIVSSYPLGGVGYSVGAGGTVVQASLKSSAFTLSAVTGKITLGGDALAGYGTSSSAMWTNTAIASSDVVIFNHVSGGTVGKYTFTAQCSAGKAVLYTANISSASLTETPILQFAVIKGAQA